LALLEIENLTVAYGSRSRPPTMAVRDVSFELEAGQFVGLVGESGSGKSTLGNAILRLLPPPGRITRGRVCFKGQDLVPLREEILRPRRWKEFSTVFQSSMNALNPVKAIETQFRDALTEHARMSEPEMRDRIAQMLEMVHLDISFLRFYPHELSGGMRQRVAIALALLLRPEFVLLDEPTTGLDVVVQSEILRNLRALQEELGFAVLLISHDLGTVLEVSDSVLVMYAGEIVESQSARDVLGNPVHPYTRALMGSYADPRAQEVAVTYIPGRPPDLSSPPTGCPFAPRCPEALPVCQDQDPRLTAMWGGKAACHVAHQWWEAELGRAPRPERPRPGREGMVVVETHLDTTGGPAHEKVLRVEGVSKTYVHRRLLKQGTVVHAVNGVSFDVRRGLVTALVGESGSGKSTLARMVMGSERPDEGKIYFGDLRIDTLKGRQLRQYRKHAQMVFQDPFAALNPTKTVLDTLSRPLVNHLGLKGERARQRARELLETVGLTPVEQFERAYPHQLSGGQQQRVVVARALAPEPELIVADEPISMLDVSIRAEILQLLSWLLRDRQIALLYITHDFLSARVLADEILVLRKGNVEERGPTLEVILKPKAPYTQLLLEAVPNPFINAGTKSE
jgi:peptide/nickel transport system ATP-binding protein